MLRDVEELRFTVEEKQKEKMIKKKTEIGNDTKLTYFNMQINKLQVTTYKLTCRIVLIIVIMENVTIMYFYEYRVPYLKENMKICLR